MLGYNFEIVYKKGKENIVADALFKKDEKDEAFCVPFQYYKKIGW